MTDRGIALVETRELTPAQRDKVLQVTRRNKTMGTIAIMRKAGLKGTRGQLHALVDDDFAADIREARGWNPDTVKAVLFDVASDPTHASWQRAAALFLKAYGGPEFRDDLRRLEHTGRDGGPISLVAGQFNPDQLTTDELEELRGLLEKARRELPPGLEVVS